MLTTAVKSENNTLMSYHQPYKTTQLYIQYYLESSTGNNMFGCGLIHTRAWRPAQLFKKWVFDSWVNLAGLKNTPSSVVCHNCRRLSAARLASRTSSLLSWKKKREERLDSVADPAVLRSRSRSTQCCGSGLIWIRIRVQHFIWIRIQAVKADR